MNMIGNGAIVEDGKVVHLVVELPYDNSELLTTGKLCCIVSPDGISPDFAEVDINGVILTCSPQCLFSTREELVRSHIKTLLEKVEFSESRIRQFEENIRDEESEMGRNLAIVHELKKELGEA